MNLHKDAINTIIYALWFGYLLCITKLFGYPSLAPGGNNSEAMTFKIALDGTSYNHGPYHKN